MKKRKDITMIKQEEWSNRKKEGKNKKQRIKEWGGIEEWSKGMKKEEKSLK